MGEEPGGRSLRFIIIGAGMSGILAAIKLEQAGHRDFVIYEKADRLGGTWRENRYPGIACDVPSHLYSYSFALNPEWSHRFAPGAEIQAYFEDVAHRFGVDRRIEYGREITRCAFEDGRWHIEAKDGTRDVGDFVIAATGVLHHPHIPDVPGLDTFEGEAFHSARWPDDLRLSGKRLGLVGTGSSAIQITSAVVDEVASFTLFQRTAQWVTPIDNPAYSEAEKAEFRAHAEAMQAIRDEVSHMFIEGFANILVDAESPVLQVMHDMCEHNLRDHVHDAALLEKLTPAYRAGCKRLIMSPDFYTAIQKPNARLVTERIECVEPNGVRTEDGELHELDVLVLATGFRVDRFVRPMQVTGRGGVPLDRIWERGPTAYMAISVPEMPNFFMLNGPNGPVGNFSLIEVAELQCEYLLQLVQALGSGRGREVCVTPEAMRAFDEARKKAAETTIWNTGCQSWYLDEAGLPTAWPWTYDRFREEMAAPRLDDYDLR
jgi:cation diffusion facilitator CzcD-associated flavoprotein CzcO